MRSIFFCMLATLLLSLTPQVQSSKNPARTMSPSDNGYENLVELYELFREFHLPVVTNGVPDYTHGGMKTKERELQSFLASLAAIDTTGWSRAAQVDYRIVLAEMNGMVFEHRVTRPWEKDPAFYAVIRFQFGPKMHPSMPLPQLPLAEGQMDRVREQFQAIPEILAQARTNLTDPVADLAHIAIYTTQRQMEALQGFIDGLRQHHRALLPDAEKAYDAIREYQAWLEAEKPGMRNGAGVGIANYNWYLEHVALMPYTWEELLLLSEREYERAVATMKQKEHRNRHIPMLYPVETREAYTERYNNAMEHLYRFLSSSEVFTLPDYLHPPNPARGFSREGERDYFQHVLDRYPLPLSVHGYAGHTHDELRTQRDDRPIRGRNRLYFVDAVRAEALATGLERIFYHTGLVDGVPRADELTYHLKAFRASRSITDLKMHSNEMTFEEAFRFNIEHTPYGWVPEDSPTLWHDLELYMRLPLYGTAYMIGPLQLDKLMTDAFLQRGQDFDLKAFMDEFLEAGMTPLSLTAYEMLGRLQHSEPTADNGILHRLMDEADFFRITESPYLGDAEGNYRENDRLPSESLADLERRNAFWQDLHEKLLQQVNRENLDPDNQIAYDLFEIELNNTLVTYAYKEHLMPGGFYNNLVGLHNRAPMQTVADYENYIRRLEAFPAYFDQHMERYRKGLETGFTLPKVLFEPEGSLYGIERQMVNSPEESDFFEPFRQFPASIPERDRQVLTQKGTEAVMGPVLKAYKGFYQFMTEEYIPNARESIGASNLPDGRRYYDHLVRYHTTLDVTAEEVHETGLREVERIRGEMMEIIRELAFEGSFEEFLEFLRTDSQFYVDDPIDLLKEASYLAKKIDSKLPELFHLSSLPRRPYGVEPVPDHLAPRYTGGRYSLGGGTRAGHFWVNTYDLPSRPLFTLEALLYHEGVPGHHLEIALSQEMENAPRRRGGVTAYSEGWALYAERLGLDVGLYQNPYSNFGRLTYEMWRACRLVVDTGIHALGWTRDEVVAFMTGNTALSHHEIDTETDRYIRSTGQAISYKMGELKIRELRSLAEESLGDRFDIRDFHEVVLHKGPVVLPQLEHQVKEYIRETQAGK
jgi:uncharacterized protein (DUF885 family)